MLRRSLRALVAALFVATLSCDSVEKPKVEPPQTSDSWQKVQLNGFSFYAPPDLQPDPSVRGIDSYFGAFKKTGLAVNFDFGMYSDDYGGDTVAIQGAHYAALLIQRNAFPNDPLPHRAILSARPQKASDPSLVLEARCASEEDLATGVLILRSLAFD
jgi:hypothetical protein